MHKVIVSGLILLSTLFCNAQSKFDYGIRFIPQATTFRFNQGVGPVIDFLKVSAPYYFRVRTAQGIGLTYKAFQHFHVGVDLMYSLQGGGYQERKTNLNYLKTPLLLGYNSVDRRRIVFMVQTGIEFAYLTSARIKYVDGKTTDISSHVKRFSYGIPFAMGIKFKTLQLYNVTMQLYVYSDIETLSKTNKVFGVYNYVYPGFRICIDKKADISIKNESDPSR